MLLSHNSVNKACDIEIEQLADIFIGFFGKMTLEHIKDLLLLIACIWKAPPSLVSYYSGLPIYTFWNNRMKERDSICDLCMHWKVDSGHILSRITKKFVTQNEGKMADSSSGSKRARSSRTPSKKTTADSMEDLLSFLIEITEFSNSCLMMLSSELHISFASCFLDSLTMRRLLVSIFFSVDIPCDMNFLKLHSFCTQFLVKMQKDICTTEGVDSKNDDLPESEIVALGAGYALCCLDVLLHHGHASLSESILPLCREDCCNIFFHACGRSQTRMFVDRAVEKCFSVVREADAVLLFLRCAKNLIGCVELFDLERIIFIRYLVISILERCNSLNSLELCQLQDESRIIACNHQVLCALVVIKSGLVHERKKEISDLSIRLADFIAEEDWGRLLNQYLNYLASLSSLYSPNDANEIALIVEAYQVSLTLFRVFSFQNSGIHISKAVSGLANVRINFFESSQTSDNTADIKFIDCHKMFLNTFCTYVESADAPKVIYDLILEYFITELHIWKGEHTDFSDLIESVVEKVPKNYTVCVSTTCFYTRLISYINVISYEFNS